MNQEYKTVLYELDEKGIARITLNRPEAMNAMSTEVFKEMLSLLGEVGYDDKVRVVIITGAGRAFCAGGDLAEMKAGYGGNHGFFQFMELVNRFTALLAELPKPVIAAVNGAATGAGMNIALASDIVIASKRQNSLKSLEM